MRIKGEFNLLQIRKGVAITNDKLNNGITDQGFNRALDLWFQGPLGPLGVNGTNTAVVMGLIDASGFNLSLYTSSGNSDTVALHPSWNVSSVCPLQPLIMSPGGTPTVRQATTDVSSVVGTRFDITANGTIKGLFIQTSDNLFLWNTAVYAGGRTLVVHADDSLFITYTVSAAPEKETTPDD